jgi:hypothetical protein
MSGRVDEDWTHGAREKFLGMMDKDEGGRMKDENGKKSLFSSSVSIFGDCATRS